MRVIAGTAKGVRLESPKNSRIRPTLDRVRESLFNILAPRIPNARFLDLFAGTGANGIEALSRGAAFCRFIDTAHEARAAIEQNLVLAKVGEAGSILSCTLPHGLAELSEGYDVVFADPPYDFDQHRELLAGLAREGLLLAGGCVIVEHEVSRALEERVGAFKRYRLSRYGRVALSFYERKS